MQRSPLACQMRARVGPGDLLVGLEAAGFAAGLGEERDGDVEEFWGEGRVEGGHEAGEGLFDGFAHGWRGCRGGVERLTFGRRREG